MPNYTYTKLEDNLIYRLNLNSKNLYVSSLYSPLSELIVERYQQSSELQNCITRPLERTYSSYLSYTKQTDLYPSLYNVELSVSNPSGYFEQLSTFYKPKDTSFDNFLPIAVRYTDNKNIWLIERPPFLANITFKNAGSSYNGSDKFYSIWMPWTVMLLVSVPEQSNYIAQLFFNDAPLSSLDERAIPCIFPNMYGDGKMCLNQTSILLQQHLSSINSYDPATIYNFILNDYMMGGWNIDLGIQVFDRIIRHSPTAAKARTIILNGDSSNKKKYPSSTTPTGRLSPKKYIPNFLNYFSHSSLEEVTAIISEAKVHDSTSSSYYTYSTYADHIRNAVQSLSTSSPFCYPFVEVAKSPSIYVSHDIYIDPPIINQITPSSLSSIEESMCNSIFEYLKDQLSSEIQSLKNNPSHYYSAYSSPSLYLDSENNNQKVYCLDPKVQDKKFFELKLPINNLEVANV